MNAIDASPADWLRAVLERQEGVRWVDFDVPPNSNRLTLCTSAGTSTTLTCRPSSPTPETGHDP